LKNTLFGSLSPEPVDWLQHHQLYSGPEADIVMESIPLVGHSGEFLHPTNLHPKNLDAREQYQYFGVIGKPLAVKGSF
jgi:hypothetical protein